MKTLEELRKDIDRIDSRLRDLLRERMEVSRQVGAWKQANGIPIYQPDREQELFEKSLSRMEEPYRQAYGEILKKIMETSRGLQGDLLYGRAEPVEGIDVEMLLKEGAGRKGYRRVAHQGIAGSYSEEALEGFFAGRAVEKMSFDTFHEAAEAVLSGRADGVMLPLENSSTGGVGEVEHLLSESGLYITGEYYLPIEHVLLGLPGASPEDLKVVYSHPQGLQQCSRFLQSRGLIAEPWFNTAMSARKVATDRDPSRGAIASMKAGSLYGLQVLARDIADNGTNFTRFVLAAATPDIRPESDRISIRLSLAHQVGSLYRIISIIAESSLNMTRIESRPIFGRPWEYYFYLDFEGNLMEPRVRSALEKIAENSSQLKFLGNYPKGEFNLGQGTGTETDSD